MVQISSLVWSGKLKNCPKKIQTNDQKSHFLQNALVKWFTFGRKSYPKYMICVGNQVSARIIHLRPGGRCGVQCIKKNVDVLQVSCITLFFMSFKRKASKQVEINKSKKMIATWIKVMKERHPASNRCHIWKTERELRSQCLCKYILVA